MDAAAYVLKRFSAADRETMDVTIREAADAVVLWATQGIQQAMNTINASPPADEKSSTGTGTSEESPNEGNSD